jgi:ABC-type phosphate transport system substrate-binding protein
MRTKLFRRAALVGGVLVASVTMIAMFAAPAGAAKAKRAPAQIVIGSGSDTTYFAMDSIDRLYNGSVGCTTIHTPQPLNFKCYNPTVTTENQYHDVVLQENPLGSSVGIAQLCSQGLKNVANINFARSSRALRTGDCPGLRQVSFARDGISWWYTPGSEGSTVPNHSLTSAQLKDIFVNCTITQWGQVNGNAADHTPIHVWTAQAGSGTRATWDGFVGGSSDACVSGPDHIIFENDAQPIIDAGDLNDAIYPYSFGRFQQNGGQGGALGKVDAIAPTTATIGNGTFPFGRFLYNVYRVGGTASLRANAATTAFLDPKTGWICKRSGLHTTNPFSGNNYRDDIETAISDNGFVPIPSGPIGGGVTGNSYCRVISYTP